MTRYNSKLRARDLKKANAALRRDRNMLYDVLDRAEHDSFAAGTCFGWRASKARAAQTYQAALVKQRRQLRNHRILSGVLLVLAIAGWLV